MKLLGTRGWVKEDQQLKCLAKGKEGMTIVNRLGRGLIGGITRTTTTTREGGGHGN